MDLIGLSLGSRWGSDDDEIIAVAKRADELGYDSIWVGEAWGRDVFTVLTMIACHTSSIRLGTGIATVFSRTPTLLAQTVASLDIISKGRAVLGLGTSGKVVIEDWHGTRYERPLQRTREYIEIVRLALSGQRVNYEGRIFRLGRFRMLVLPVQENLPIFVASLGPKNLALTGELADGWLPTFVHLDHLPGMKGQVEEAASRSGRSAEVVTAAPQVPSFVARNPVEYAEGRRLIADHIAYYLGGMGTYYDELFHRYGFGEESGRIRQAWAQNDREKAASLIPDAILEKLAILGNAEECRAKLGRYRENGASMPVIFLPHRSSLEATIRTLEALAPVT